MSLLSFRAALPLGLCGAALLLGACSQTVPTSQPVTLRGHITHPKGPKVRLTFFRDPLHLNPDTASARLDAQGNFRLVLPSVTAPGEATFTDGNELASLFLEPGDDLELSLDTEKFDETLTFKGKGEAANNYLIQSYLRFEDKEDASPLAKAAELAPAQMGPALDAYQQQREEFLRSYAAAHPLTPAFRAYARQSLRYGGGGLRLMYAGMYRSLHPGQQNVQAELQAFTAPLKPLATPNDSALNNGAYTAFATGYAYSQLGAGAPGGEDQLTPLFALVPKLYGESRTRDLVLGSIMLEGLSTAGLSAVTPNLPTFKRLNRDSAAARQVRQQYQRRLALAPGQTAPAFTLTDNAGKQVSLSDFRGKVVYLDFWASWCGPCLAEVPAAAELKQKFAGRDVVFLYVSIDEQEKPWLDMLAKRSLAGHGSVHVRAAGFNAPTPVAYQVNAIPSYWIIGRDGRIVAEQAPRPSSGAKVVAALEAALAGGAVAAR